MNRHVVYWVNITVLALLLLWYLWSVVVPLLQP